MQHNMDFLTGSVLSSFTMGESSLREGLIREQVNDATFTSDKVYLIKSIESSANASIDIIGFANRDILGTSEIFGVTPNAPEGYASTSSGEFPAFILYGMAGMAAIGGAVMYADEPKENYQGRKRTLSIRLELIQVILLVYKQVQALVDTKQLGVKHI